MEDWRCISIYLSILVRLLSRWKWKYDECQAKKPRMIQHRIALFKNKQKIMILFSSFVMVFIKVVLENEMYIFSLHACLLFEERRHFCLLLFDPNPKEFNYIYPPNGDAFLHCGDMHVCTELNNRWLFWWVSTTKLH